MTQAETQPPQVVFYRERSGRVPIQNWLDRLPFEQNPALYTQEIDYA